jgi:hypothetical protein
VCVDAYIPGRVDVISVIEGMPGVAIVRDRHGTTTRAPHRIRHDFRYDLVHGMEIEIPSNSKQS